VWVLTVLVILWLAGAVAESVIRTATRTYHRGGYWTRRD